MSGIVLLSYPEKGPGEVLDFVYASNNLRPAEAGEQDSALAVAASLINSTWRRAHATHRTAVNSTNHELVLREAQMQRLSRKQKAQLVQRDSTIEEQAARIEKMKARLAEFDKETARRNERA